MAKANTVKERLFLYDTTLRDGQQTQGVQFSTPEKHQICAMLDRLGVDYIEGGWPGANPTDSAFFAEAPETRARMAAFGMTKRAGRSAENDDVLAAVMNAGTKSVCLVGKSHDYHVTAALGISLEENLDNIAQSVAHIVAQGREALFDAEHFFDGYKANAAYALECLRAAHEAGARWIVLCDTNGGTLPVEIGQIVGEVIAAGIPGDHLGIHTHNDTANAVAGSLAAVDAGVRQIQGTLNGLGERCGNANLVTLIPTLLLKEPYRSRYETGVSEEALQGLTQVSRQLDDILNRVPVKQAPYVGASAFAHKAGLHASAILKDPSTYEHVDPGVVGNTRVIPMSNQAGQSNLRRRLAEGTEDLSEQARERVIAARESAVRARARAASYGREGRDRAVDMYEEQPLIAGALALAVGAAIGAALPRSRTEDRYMGQHSDQLMADAERIFAEEKAKLGKVAQAASDEAKKVLRETKEDADAAAPGDTAADAIVEKAKASVTTTAPRIGIGRCATCVPDILPRNGQTQTKAHKKNRRKLSPRRMLCLRMQPVTSLAGPTGSCPSSRAGHAPAHRRRRRSH